LSAGHTRSLRLCLLVQPSIKKNLEGKKIGFAVDAWTEDGAHFVAIIAITPTDKFLLALSTLLNESDMSADATIEIFDYVLDTYGIDAATQLCFLVCDHASVNVAIARNLESVNKKLQTAMLTLLDVRALFHHVINHYPTTKTHLAASATLVKFPDFESGIVKVLAGKERSLTRAERSAAAKLLQADNSKPTTLVAEAAPPTQVDLR
ncbi:hypothetical protein JG687_00015789, partial [Phytophthora cactorum]